MMLEWWSGLTSVRSLSCTQVTATSSSWWLRNEEPTGVRILDLSATSDGRLEPTDSERRIHSPALKQMSLASSVKILWHSAGKNTVINRVFQRLQIDSFDFLARWNEKNVELLLCFLGLIICSCFIMSADLPGNSGILTGGSSQAVHLSSVFLHWFLVRSMNP